MQEQAAQTIALQALAFLVGDDERLARFLGLSGITLEDLRAAPDSREILCGVLDHLLGDESLLLAYSANAAIPPERIGQARSALSGEPPLWESAF